MPTRLVLVSDTHVPTRAKDLPPALWRDIDEADLVIHAGDWMAPTLLDALERRAARLVGVWGNNDGDELRRRLPEVAHCRIDGVRFAVTHETGQKTGREQRMATIYPDADVLVFGHSHIPWDTRAATGLRLLNPGSPTDRRRQPVCTWMRAVADAGELLDVRLVPVDR